MPAINFSVFIDKVKSGEKRQTIRPVGKIKYEAGDMLYLYTGMRTKECRKICEVVCKEVIPVTFACIYGGLVVTKYGDLLYDVIAQALCYEKMAKDDGFASWSDMGMFFVSTYKLEHGDKKSMQIIKW